VPDVDVDCYIVLPPGFLAAPTPCTLTLSLEDVTRIDAPAVVVVRSQFEMAPASGRSLERRGPYRLRVPALRPDAIYNVRGEMDCDRDGRIGPGDLLSTAHHPVAAQAGLQEVTLQLHRI
jgi:hypothetical protein